MSVLFCSDLHLNHKLASGLRGFESTEEHDASIFEQLNKQCSKRTILYVLGDVCMRDKSKLAPFGSLPGRKIMVRGNHDEFDVTDYLRYFENVLGFAKYKNMWLSHCPMHPQELYNRVNVHGHIHENTNSPLIPMPYFNVNWDFWRRAVSLDEIRQVVEKWKNETGHFCYGSTTWKPYEAILCSNCKLLT